MPPATLTVDGPAIDVTQAALRVLASYGARPVEGTVNRVRFPFAARDNVAICSPIQVQVQRQGRIANARDGYVDLTMVPVENSPTVRTGIEVRLIGRYTAPGNTGVLEAPCRSTGEVERRLTEIIAAEGG